MRSEVSHRGTEAQRLRKTGLERGLVVRRPHIGKILDGLKTWEMRSKPTKIRGRIGLIEAGSGLVLGEAELVRVQSAPKTEHGRRITRAYHCIEEDRCDLMDRWPFAWVLAQVCRFDKPSGFSCSSIDRTFVKERASYHGRLRLLGRFASFWKTVTLENLGFDELIRTYGKRHNVIFYCDPPYYGTEKYYSRGFAPGNHVMLAEQLRGIEAAAVSYYPFPGIKDLYPTDQWDHLEIQTVKNSIGSGKKAEVTELLLVKKPN